MTTDLNKLNVRDFYRQHLGVVWVLCAFWGLFAVMEFAGTAYFSGQFPSLTSMARAAYILLPWIAFSAFCGWITVRLHERHDRNLIYWGWHGCWAICLGLIHVGILASAFWVFSPAQVSNVSVAFVLGEQFVKWFHFELLVYFTGVLLWQWRLSRDLVFGEDSPNRAPLVISTESGLLRVEPEEIEWLQADDNYLIVHCLNGPHRLRATLRSMLDKLGEERFIQTHRSAAVNVKRVVNVESNRVTLRSGARAPVSRRRRANLCTAIKSPATSKGLS